MQILHLACTTLFLYDFYNYGPAQPEFFSTLKEFLQVCYCCVIIVLNLGLTILKQTLSQARDRGLLIFALCPRHSALMG